jgi:cytidylate kinase
MNAVVKILSGTALAHAIDVLEIRAAATAYLEYEHQYEHLADPVDPLQEYAQRSGVVAAIGQDAVQAIIAAPFARFRAIVAAEIETEERRLLELEPADSHGVDEIVRRLELADPRDRWKHAGELAPAPEVIPTAIARKRGVPTSTIEAFKYVVSVGNPDHLAKWLRDHSDVAAALLKEVA